MSSVREEYNFYRLQKAKKDADRNSEYDNKRVIRFKKNTKISFEYRWAKD